MKYIFSSKEVSWFMILALKLRYRFIHQLSEISVRSQVMKKPLIGSLQIVVKDTKFTGKGFFTDH
jgi:hypothetical protein